MIDGVAASPIDADAANQQNVNRLFSGAPVDEIVLEMAQVRGRVLALLSRLLPPHLDARTRLADGRPLREALARLNALNSARGGASGLVGAPEQPRLTAGDGCATLIARDQALLRNRRFRRPLRIAMGTARLRSDEPRSARRINVGRTAFRPPVAVTLRLHSHSGGITVVAEPREDVVVEGDRFDAGHD